MSEHGDGARASVVRTGLSAGTYYGTERDVVG